MRCVLRGDVGPHHRLQQPVPVVLPRVLRCNDCPSSATRHNPLQEEIRPGLGGVYSPSSLALHSGELHVCSQIRLTFDSMSSECIFDSLPSTYLEEPSMALSELRGIGVYLAVIVIKSIVIRTAPRPVGLRLVCSEGVDLGCLQQLGKPSADRLRMLLLRLVENRHIPRLR